MKLFLTLLLLSSQAHAAFPIVARGGCAFNLIAGACVPTSSGGSAAWGSITGTLGSQADLVAALGGKQNSLGYTPLNAALNFSDIGNAGTARGNLGLGTAATHPATDFQTALTPGNASTSTPGLTVVGTASTVGPAIMIDAQTATNGQPGLLSAADHTAFAAKQNALTPGNASSSTTGVTVVGTASTVGPAITVDIQTSTNSQPGLISAADHTAFNAKQPAGNYLTGTSGDVVSTGPGTVAATIQSNVVTNAKAAQMAANTIKGNNTGLTANAADLTATQTTAMLSPVVGAAAGASGVQGVAPAPAAGSDEQGLVFGANGAYNFNDTSKPSQPSFKLLSQTAEPAGTIKAQSISFITGPSGNTYAVMAGGQNTMSVYNVTNQAAPVLRGSLSLDGSYMTCPGAWPYVYVPSSGSSKLYTMDLTNPSTPVKAATLAITGAPGSLYGCAYAGGYVFLATQSAGLTVVDVGGGGVATPLAPNQVYQEGGGVKSFGIAWLNSTTLFTTVYQTTAPWTNRFLKTWNISTPSAPTLSNTYTLTAGAKPGRVTLNTATNTAFVTDLNGTNGVMVVDITTPASPSVLSSLTPSATMGSGFAAAATSGSNYVYVPSGSNATYGGIIDFYDITTRSSPVKVGSSKSGTANSFFGMIGLDPRGGYLWAADYGVAPGSAGNLDLFSLPSEVLTAGAVNASAVVLPGGDVQGQINALVAGSSLESVSTKTANYTTLLTDKNLLGDATGGTFTFTLPSSASAFVGGKSYVFSFTKIDSGANSISITAAGADTILGAASVSLNVQNKSGSLFTDGGGHWYVK